MIYIHDWGDSEINVTSRKVIGELRKTKAGIDELRRS
jgi:hypothetical protein